MKVQVTTDAGVVTVSALLYAFPKKGNAPEGYTLKIAGQEVKTAQTGGGKYPRYVYIMINDTSHYLPKNIIPVSGTEVTIIKEEPKAAPAPKAAAEPKATPAPKAEAKATPAPRKRIPKAEQQQAAA